MGLFSRRRTAVMVRPEAGTMWRPESSDILACAGHLMESECAGEQAFGARFRNAAQPASRLTIWAFPAECGPGEPGYYFVAFRIDYAVDDEQGGEPWSVSLYHGDVSWSEWYPYLDTATDAARAAAADLIWQAPGANLLHAQPESVAEWFDWDGTPW